MKRPEDNVPQGQEAPQVYPGQQNAPYPPQQGVPPPYAQPYQQPPPGQGQPYPPPQGQAGYTVVTVPPPAVAVGVTFRETPVRTQCPACRADVMTSVDFESGLMTWLACLGICGVGLIVPCAWLGCCFIPFCVTACKDAIHRCPNCQAEVGRYKRM